jgi:hypothetical protein
LHKIEYTDTRIILIPPSLTFYRRIKKNTSNNNVTQCIDDVYILHYNLERKELVIWQVQPSQ